MALYLLLADKLGYSYLVCWIRNDLSRLETLILVFAEFYGILPLVLLVNLYCFIKTINHTRGSMSKRQAYQLLFFPLVLLVCFLGALVDRIVMSKDTDSGPVWLRIWNISGAQFFGFLNALIYGYNKNIRNIVWQSAKCGCRCRKERTINPSHNSIMASRPFLTNNSESNESSEQMPVTISTRR